MQTHDSLISLSTASAHRDTISKLEVQIAEIFAPFVRRAHFLNKADPVWHFEEPTNFVYDATKDVVTFDYSVWSQGDSPSIDSKSIPAKFFTIEDDAQAGTEYEAHRNAEKAALIAKTQAEARKVAEAELRSKNEYQEYLRLHAIYNGKQ